MRASSRVVEIDLASLICFERLKQGVRIQRGRRRGRFRTDPGPAPPPFFSGDRLMELERVAPRRPAAEGVEPEDPASLFQHLLRVAGDGAMNAEAGGEGTMARRRLRWAPVADRRTAATRDDDECEKPSPDGHERLLPRNHLSLQSGIQAKGFNPVTALGEGIGTAESATPALRLVRPNVSSAGERPPGFQARRGTAGRGGRCDGTRTHEALVGHSAGILRPTRFSIASREKT